MHIRPVFLTCLHTLLLLATICAFFSMFHVSYATVINVPQDYPTIQQAITAASDGDTIHVGRRSGESQSVYHERLLIEDKQLSLIGESRETIIIDGGGAGTVIRIRWNNVEIRGFTIRNGGKYSGIRANSYSYITVVNNTIEASKDGISLINSNYNTVVQNLLLNNSAAGISLSESIGNNISDNSVSESAYGIKLSFTNATFMVNNTVADNSYGIYIEYSSNDTVDKNTLMRNQVDGIFPHACHDIIVSNNEVSESAYGIQLYNSDAITVLGNDAMNSSYGVYLAYSGPSNTIENNTISRNDWGVKLYDSSGNTFIGNTLSYNTFGVDPVAGSNNNLFYHNDFLENVEQVVWNPDCLNTWDNGYPSGGNYWSDYTGVDEKSGSNQDQLGSDGIGDTSYVIDPMNKDRYPLMERWGVKHDAAVINVTLSETQAYVGETINITVTLENQGTETETFNVTVRYENTTLGISEFIDTKLVTSLAANDNANLTFSWDTADVQPCVNYTIIAEANVLPNELDTTDNTYIDGKVKVKMPGDVNGDGVVDVVDLTIVSLSYGLFEGEPGYDPVADLNKDGLVDMRDLVEVAMNLGKTC